MSGMIKIIRVAMMAKHKILGITTDGFVHHTTTSNEDQARRLFEMKEGNVTYLTVYWFTDKQYRRSFVRKKQRAKAPV